MLPVWGYVVPNFFLEDDYLCFPAMYHHPVPTI
jgi:hypothetical protein